MKTKTKIILGTLASMMLMGCSARETAVPAQSVEQINPADREKMKSLTIENSGINAMQEEAKFVLAHEFNDMTSLGGPMSTTGSDSRFESIVRDYRKNRI